MRKKVLWIIALVLLLPLITVGLGLVPINLSWLKADIAEWVSDQSGLDLQVKGDLKLRLGFKPQFVAQEIVLGNPAENDQVLLKLDQLSTSPQILPLLKGKFLFRELTLAGTSLDYCQRNFPAPKQATESSDDQNGPRPEIAVDKLHFTDFSPVCSNTDEVQNWMPGKLDVAGTIPLGKPLAVKIQSMESTQAFSLSLSGESLDKLLDQPGHFSFQGDFEIPGEVLLSLEAETVPGGVDIEQLDGTIAGTSFQLTGQAMDLFSRPRVEVSASLDSLDITAFMNSDGSNGEVTIDSLDFQQFYEVLSAFDAKFKVEAGQLLSAPVRMDDLHIEGELQAGLLTIKQAGARLDDNPVTAEFSLDTRTPCANLKSHLQTSLDDLGDLASILGENSALGGTLDRFEISTDSCGATASDHLDSLQATLAVAGLAPQWSGETLPLLVDSIDASISWGKPGQLQYEGEFLAETISAQAGFGSMESLLSAARWPLDLELSALESHLSLNGHATLLEDSSKLNLDIAFEAPRPGALQPWTGLDSSLDQPLTGKLSLEKDGSGLSLHGLAVNLGASDLGGNVKWNGRGSAKGISADLKSQMIDLNELDLVYVKNTSPGVAKQASALSREEFFNKWMSLPPIEMLLSVEKVRGIEVDVDDARLQAHISDRQIEDALLGFRIGDLTFDGSLEMDFRKQPWNLSFDSVLQDINIGNLLSALGAERNINATASTAHFQINTSGNSIRELVGNAETESTIDNVKWVFGTGPENEQHEVKLSSLELTTALATQSTWRSTGSINGVPFKAAMKTPRLRTTFGGTGTLPVSLAFETGQDVVLFEAHLEREKARVRRIDLSVSGESAAPGGTDLLMLKAPLAEYQLNTQINLNENELHFSGLDARVGSSELGGDFRIRYETPIYGFDVDLESRFIETEDFVQWVADWRDSIGRLVQNETTETTEEEAPAGMIALIAANMRELAGRNRVKAGIQIEELRSAGTLLGRTRFEMEVNKDEFHFDRVSMELPDGHVKASITGQAREPGFEYVIKADIANLEYGGLLRLINSESKAEGTVFLDVELTSHVPEFSQLARDLGGYVDMLAIPVDSGADFLDLWASNLVFALLSSQGDSRKQMNCMVARFEVEDGIMHTKKTFLDSTDIIVRARGDIDLVQKELDLVVAPQAKVEKFLSVSAPVTVTGPFDDFEIKVAPGGFVMTMVRWYYGLIYVPWKWLTGERFPADGLATCFKAVDVTPGVVGSE